MKRFVTDRNKYLAELAQGLEVLDVGCVNHDLQNRKEGHWLHDSLRGTAKDIVGLDYEAEYIRKLQAEGYNVVCADATDFDLSRQFDVIVAGELLEHLANAGGFLTCAHRHLRPGGKLVLTMPNAVCLNYFVQNLLKGRELDNLDHCCLYSETTLRCLLKRYGFQVESVLYYPELPGESDSLVNRLSWWGRQIAQYFCAPWRPSLCHHFITIASPINRMAAVDKEK